MIYAKLRAALLTFGTVTDAVGKNTKFAAIDDQYAIRPGRLHELDPYPGIVLALPNTNNDSALSGRGGFSTATLEVRCISLDCDQSWNLLKAAAWNGGEPDDETRLLSGLDGYRNFSGNGLQAIRLTNILEDTFEPNDKSDRMYWIVQGSFSVEFDLGMGIV
jgi:hypothetical protein